MAEKKKKKKRRAGQLKALVFLSCSIKAPQQQPRRAEALGRTNFIKYERRKREKKVRCEGRFTSETELTQLESYPAFTLCLNWSLALS